MNGSIKRGQKPERIKFYYKDIISSIYDTLLEMTPYVDEDRLHDIDDIILCVVQKFFVLNDKDTFPKLRYERNPFLYMTDSEFEKWLIKTLSGCPTFTKLNLSYNEILNNVNVNDSNRVDFVVTSGYDVDTEESWKNDFIDLDAAIGNIYRAVIQKYNDNKDCITCEYNYKDSKYCKTCLRNPTFKYNYYHTNKPFGDDIMRWCSKGCPEGFAVCCYDCSHKNECKERCCGSYFMDDKTVKCNSMIFRKDRKSNE